MHRVRKTFRILRQDPEEGGKPAFQEFALEVPEGMTVLEALRTLQAEQDGALAFRYACRGAVCGSCAMRINGRIDLACRVQVLGEAEPVITLEPLPNLPVLKDLVVDMEPFFAKNRAIRPWLAPPDPSPEKERNVPPEALKEGEPYTNCILCASCNGVCPAVERDGGYLGPAALAKHYRFLADVRDGAAGERIARVDGPQGVWGCDMVWNCVKVCPKGVPPTKGIAKTRARIKGDARK
ncbi:MAG: succinate dehydrogenase/fumarate reductase iron-sulfur subunit [Planctomycetota bacterium]|jgi:succinate dehydrogenase / fumarate reductase iron-sulfur subunit